MDFHDSLLIDNIPVGIIKFDKNNNCVYLNKKMTDILGTDKLNEVYKKYMENIHPEDAPDVVSGAVSYRLFNHHLNEYRWILNTKTHIDNQYYIYTIQDIHTNKSLEIELRNQKIKAEEAYSHKSIFLANMSHEIRTPLNGIIGMLTLLEDTSLSTEQSDYIQMIKECSYNLMTIINDILDYSKLEVGKITLENKSMCLYDCIASTNDIVLSKLHEKNLEFVYNVNSDIPYYIYGDCNRLKQILLNLITNAIKFTDSGTIFLNINQINSDEFYSITDASPDTDAEDRKCVFLRIDISDTGCGIKQEEQSKLFKSFSQVDNSITNKIYQGTGLGLAISKELVELMGGKIWLEWSEPGEGSQFSFVIKTYLSDEDQISYDDSNESLLHDTNVLIIDDNIYNRISLMGMVSKWGMKPYAFSNSEEALYYTKLTPFHIGLIDICMPKLDGIGFAAKLREQKEFNNKSFPLIALSSLGDNPSGITKYFKTQLIKPIKENKLKQICIDILRKYKRSDAQIRINSEHLHEQSHPLNEYLTQNHLNEIRESVRILLAEDVYINQKVIVSFLNKIGYNTNNITVVENGEQCVEHIQSSEYDIVLLDIRMPIVNGEDALKKIKKYFEQQKNSKRMPYIVAVTAYCLKNDREKYLKLGFDDYIPKPITIKDLSKCMDKFISNLLHE